MPPSYRITVSRRAESDLDGILQHISLDAPSAAIAMKGRILDAIDGLHRMPSRFRAVGKSRRRGSPVHAVVVKPYLIYYRVDERERTSIRVLDPAWRAQAAARVSLIHGYLRSS